MTVKQAAVLLALLAQPVGEVHATGPCTDEHYRWTVKTTLALEGDAPAKTTPSAMLKWAPRKLYRPPIGTHVCTPRASRELKVYAVTGWARSWHIEKGPKGDLDWHIELTQSAKTDSLECVVVEIPDPKYGAVFDTARKDFLNLLGNSKPNKKKWLVPRITVVGPALFDAQHRGAKDSGNPPTGHGNCNSSDSALWEIHPVYRIMQP